MIQRDRRCHKTPNWSCESSLRYYGNPWEEPLMPQQASIHLHTAKKAASVPHQIQKEISFHRFGSRDFENDDLETQIISKSELMKNKTSKISTGSKRCVFHWVGFGWERKTHQRRICHELEMKPYVLNCGRPTQESTQVYGLFCSFFSVTVFCWHFQIRHSDKGVWNFRNSKKILYLLFIIFSMEF